MAKLTAVLVTLIGVLLVLPLLGVTALAGLTAWVVPLSVLVIGLGKLMRNYKAAPKKKR